MPETFEALGTLALALLPGALYVWSFERLVGLWGIRLTDRLLRFVGVSATLHVLFLPVTYRLWIEYVTSGRLSRGDVSLALWGAPLLYVILPVVLGSVVGRATLVGKRWPKLITGPTPAPRAWDYLFGTRPDGWIRLRLKTGKWLAGAYTKEAGNRKSYAAGYPEEQDLYLVETVEVDPTTGVFVYGDDGLPVPRRSGILIRWSEVEYLELIEG